MSASAGLFDRWRAEPRARVAVVSLGVLLIACYGAPLWCAALGLDPYNVDPLARHLPASLRHPLGTDDLGRDFLARLLFGGRVSLAVALLAALGSVTIGTALGLAAGHYRGWTDRLFLRATDAVMALPRLPLLLLVLGLDLGRFSLGHGGAIVSLVAVIVLFGWTTPARIARAAALEIGARPFVEAARATGASEGQILWRHVLPHAASPLIVTVTLEIGSFVLYESALSYLGLGIPPPVPSWGSLLSEGFSQMSRSPMLMIFPGLLTAWAVAAFNLAGEALRDALDPKSARLSKSRRWV